MCEVGEDLQFKGDTIHYSVCLFDAFYSKPHVQDILNSIDFLSNKLEIQIYQLVALVCVMIAAKFNERTYPGV